MERKERELSSKVPITISTKDIDFVFTWNTCVRIENSLESIVSFKIQGKMIPLGGFVTLLGSVHVKLSMYLSIKPHFSESFYQGLEFELLEKVHWASPCLPKQSFDCYKYEQYVHVSRFSDQFRLLSILPSRLLNSWEYRLVTRTIRSVLDRVMIPTSEKIPLTFFCPP